MCNKIIKRKEVYYCNLGNGVGSEQEGIRPVLIISNDIGNKFSTTAIIIPFVKKIRLALILSITITFIPEIFNCWNKVSLAAAARTPIGKNGKRKTTVRIFNAQITAFFFNMLQYAEQVRRAICNRTDY